jgi:hypothetical protein
VNRRSPAMTMWRHRSVKTNTAFLVRLILCLVDLFDTSIVPQVTEIIKLIFGQPLRSRVLLPWPTPRR